MLSSRRGAGHQGQRQRALLILSIFSPDRTAAASGVLLHRNADDAQSPAMACALFDTAWSRSTAAIHQTRNQTTGFWRGLLVSSNARKAAASGTVVVVADARDVDPQLRHQKRKDMGVKLQGIEAAPTALDLQHLPWRDDEL